jgi:16S rRNA processing protein RimM
MIFEEEYIFAGFILKTHGYQGHLILKSENLAFDHTAQEEYIFLEIEGICVPFFVEEWETAGNQTSLLKLEGIGSDQEAHVYKGTRCYLKGSRKVEKTAPSGLSKFIGYQFSDSPSGTRGSITDVDEIPGNPVLIIETTEGEEVYVPYHKDLIENTDHKNKLLVMKLPDGMFNKQ